VPVLRRSPALIAAIALAAVAGIVLRILSLRGVFGATDSDEAIWTLMSRHVLDGEFPAYFWGQGYGGTIEVYLASPFLWAFGGGVGAARAAALLLTCVATTLVWIVGRHAFDVQRATVAAVLFWVWPAYAVWKSTRFNGFYVSGQILGLLAILLVLRLAERPGRRDAALLGLVLGLAAWQTWQLVPVLVPALAWLAYRRPAAFRLARIGVAGLVIGALPAIASNLRHDGWSRFTAPGGGTYPSRLQGFFTATLPSQLGLRVPFTLEWLVPRPLAGLILLAAIVGALMLGWRHRSTAVGLLVAVAAGFPLLYALSPYTWYVDEPRYLLVLAPVVALLVAGPLRRPLVAAAAIVVAIALSIGGFAAMDSNGEFARRNGDVTAVANIASLVRALDDRGVRSAFSEFWLAYRLTLASGERIVVVPRGDSHYPPYLHRVEGSPFPAYVFYAGSAAEAAARATELESLGYRRQVVGGFAIWSRPAEGAGS
jgi:hypothetical protein